MSHQIRPNKSAKSQTSSMDLSAKVADTLPILAAGRGFLTGGQKVQEDGNGAAFGKGSVITVGYGSDVHGLEVMRHDIVGRVELF